MVYYKGKEILRILFPKLCDIFDILAAGPPDVRRGWAAVVQAGRRRALPAIESQDKK